MAVNLKIGRKFAVILFNKIVYSLQYLKCQE